MFKEAKQCQAFSPTETLFEGHTERTQVRLHWKRRRWENKYLLFLRRVSVTLKWLYFLLLSLATIWRGKYEVRGPPGQVGPLGHISSCNTEACAKHLRRWEHHPGWTTSSTCTPDLVNCHILSEQCITALVLLERKLRFRKAELDQQRAVGNTVSQDSNLDLTGLYQAHTCPLQLALNSRLLSQSLSCVWLLDPMSYSPL